MAELSTLGSVIKAAYEGEANTNAYTDAEKSKLAGIEAGAQVNPSVATTSSDGLMSSADKAKLDGIEAGANNYSLPAASASVRGGVLMATAVADAADETEAVARLNDLLAALRASGVLAV